MLPDRVSNPGPLTYESGALPIALCGQALLESAEGETKVCGRTGYRTRDLWLLKQTQGEGTYTDQIGGGEYGGGRGLGRGRLIEGCRNKVERCTV